MDTARFGESAGFLLAELLPALILSALFFGLLSSLFVAITRSISYQDHALRVRQTLGASLYRIVGDIRMAGCNPWGVSPLTGFEPDPDRDGTGDDLLLRFDRRGTEIGSLPDGDGDDPDELVLYEWNGADRVLRRNHQPMALEVVENPGQQGIFESSSIGQSRLVAIRLTMKPLGGQRPFTLSTKIWVRNPS
jgi:hypothetical protein